MLKSLRVVFTLVICVVLAVCVFATSANPSPLARHVAQVNISRADAENVKRNCGIRPSLGIITIPAFGAPPPIGYRIDFLARRGLASVLGLRMKDVVLQVNDKEIFNVGDIRSAMTALRPGDTVKVSYVRQGIRTTVAGKVPDPPSLASYVLVENRGLHGVVELGESYADVVDRLGSPEYVGYTQEGVLAASYSSLGLSMRFSGLRRPTCDTLAVGWPFVGQSALGLPTDGTEKDVVRIFGDPFKIIQLRNPDMRVLEFANGRLKIIEDELGAIQSIILTTVPNP